jgi:hypothetical protein
MWGLISLFILLIIIFGIMLDWEGEGIGFFAAYLITLFVGLIAFPFQAEKYYFDTPTELQKIEGKKFIRQEGGWVIRENGEIRVINTSTLKIKDSNDSSYTAKRYMRKIRNFTPIRRTFLLTTKKGLDTTDVFQEYIHYQVHNGFEYGLIQNPVYVYDTIHKTVYQIDTIGSSKPVFIK